MKEGIIRYESDPATSHWETADKTSANIVPIVPKARGKGEKWAKGLVRIYGPGRDLKKINEVAAVVADWLSKGLIEEDLFEGKKQMAAVKVAQKLGLDTFDKQP